MGSRLLKRIRHLRPETTRVLLTGAADLGSAIEAVSRGSIIRFLTKPCEPENLFETAQAAVVAGRSTTSLPQ